MPIYEYRCTECEDEFETTQSISADPLNTCEKCNGKLERLISASAFHLKGTGWYKTDYATPKKDNGNEKKDGTEKGDGKTDTKKNAGKKETKKEGTKKKETAKSS